MNLKEEFKFALWEDAESGNEIEDKCEKVAEYFAIGFAEFVTGITYKLSEGYFFYYYNEEWKTTKELLEIYKKGQC